MTGIDVVVAPYLSNGPLFIAQEEGYFAEQDLQVRFINLSRTAESIPALSSGRVDVIGGYLSAGFINAIARGARIRFVADKGYIGPGCTEMGLLARRDLAGRLNNSAQLKKRRIIVTPVSSSGYYTERILNTIGLSVADMEVHDMPEEIALEAFKKGTIDLQFATEPWISRTVQSGYAFVWKDINEVLPDAEFSILVYGPNLLDRNPDAGKRFMIAYLKGVEQYAQGKTERNIAVMAKSLKLEKEFLKRLCWPCLRKDGYINVEGVLDFNRWAVQKGLAGGLLTKDELWDSRFVDFANSMIAGKKEHVP